MYWKKDGTKIDRTEITHYVRATDPWSPDQFLVQATSSLILSPGTYTLFCARNKTIDRGNLVNNITISSSFLSILSERYTLS